MHVVDIFIFGLWRIAMKTQTKLFIGISFLTLLLGACSTSMDQPSLDSVDTVSSVDTSSEEAPHVHTEATREENRDEATCLEKGSYDLVTYCSECLEVLKTESKEIEALGHDLVHHEAKDATCLDKGYKAYDTCSRCDYTTYEEIKATGHLHEETREEYLTPKTCTEDGTYNLVKFCPDCGTVLSSEGKTIPHGHELSQYPGMEATCTEEGWEAYEACSNCDYTTYTSIPKLGHNWGSPSYEFMGSQYRAYRTCNYLYPHMEEEFAYGIYEVVTEPTSMGNGLGRYTYTFTNPAFETKTREVVIKYVPESTSTDAFAFEDIDGDTVRVTGFAPNYSYDEIVIPSTYNEKTVVEIADNAFKNNLTLNRVHIPDSIKTIGSSAFEGCLVLQKVNLGEGITTISSRAFYGAGLYAKDGITFSQIPQSVNSISRNAFELANVAAYDVHALNGKYYSNNGMLFAFNYGSYGKTLLFYPLSKTGDIEVPNDVKYIEEFGLTSLYAENININNAKLNELIDFRNCSACQAFEVGSSNPNGYFVDDGILYQHDSSVGNVLLTYPKEKSDTSIEVAAGTTVIEQYAFKGNNHIESVTLPSSMRFISFEAFKNCYNLKAINLDSIDNLGSAVFEGCSSLEGDITFGSGLEVITQNTFKNCAKLHSVTLPSTVEYINNSAFEGCTSLASVTFSDDLLAIKSHAFKGCTALNSLIFGNDTDFVIEDEAFINAGLNYNLVLPDNCTSVGVKAFANTKLKGITFSGGMSEIKERTCINCYQLETVTIPSNIKTIGAYAFELTGTKQGSLKSVYIADGVETIKARAFSGQLFNSIFVPSSVTTIEAYAFAVNNGSLLSNNQLSVYTDVKSPNGYQYRPEGWSGSFVGSSVTWVIYNGRTRS